MKKPQIDFHLLFDSAPGCFLAIAPDAPRFTILAATDAFLSATGTRRIDILGKGFLEVFPEYPADDSGDAKSSFRGIVELVRPDAAGIRKFGIPRPETEGEGIEDRRWAAVDFPVLDADGQVAYIIRRIEDMDRSDQPALAELRQNREDLDRAQAVAQIGSWRLDIRRDVLAWSDECYRIFGVPKGTPMTYETFLACAHPEDRAYIDASWQEGLRGKPYDIEHRIMANGQVKWVREKAYLEFDSAGRLLGGFGIVQDITERKAAEEALRTSEAKLRAVLDATQESIWVFDPDGAVLLANTIGLSRMRTTAPEVIGKRMIDVLHPDLARLRMKHLREVVETGRPVEFEDERAGFQFHHSFYPARDQAGRVMFVVSFSRDITERRKVEALRQALAEQDRLRLGAAVEQASDAVIMFDLDGTIQYVNAAFESINLLPRGQAIGRSYFDFFADDPSAAAIRKAVEEGRAWHGPVTRSIPDGRTIELEAMFSPAKDPAGKVIGGLATEADVTQKNALQRQIRQAQKMEALGTLAGGITHDFNNILGAIIINTEMALLEMDASDPSRKTLPVVLQAANRGKELVKQIITFSRQRAWERKPLEIAPIVNEGLGLLRSTLPKDISIRETIDEGSGVILADPSHIHQILVNLCQNAALAMRDRGGDMKVGLAPVDVDAAMALRLPDLVPGPYVRLTVADTGCGMTNDVVDRIFEPFFTTRERGKGSGLGLAVVHGLVKGYNGAISVQSKPGQGSVFDIYLPRLGESVLAAGAEPSPKPARGRARIMLVEDEEAQRTSLAQGLEYLGYEVTPAPEGRSALAMFRKNPDHFDLIITDQIMPLMTGLELASELSKVRTDIPVILCTGFSEKIDGGTIGQNGIRELAMKPFTITEMSQLIRKVLKSEIATGSTAPLA